MYHSHWAYFLKKLENRVEGEHMRCIIVGIALSSVVVSTLLSSQDSAPEVKKLRQEVDELREMISKLQRQKKAPGYRKGSDADISINSELARLNETVAELRSELEGNAKSGFLLTGYTSFDWTDAQGEDNEFSGVKFAPIFHYQYGQLFQFEGELELILKEDGETETELEYAAGTLFLNDYMGLQMGKFLSPIGQYVQNLHPSWINKLPSNPLGFGHDGAAPTSNVGIALRGGLPKVFDTRSNYVLFVSNAPTFGVADDGDVVVGASGKTTANDVSKTFGGRFAINPVSGMEVGISSATGKIAEKITVGTDTYNISRDYDVYGFDAMYNVNGFDFKAEHIEQHIGENSASTLTGGKWRAWYAQASYQFTSFKFEPVLRYSDYHNPEQERNQWAVGLNYLFANNVIAKLAYEYNTDEDDDTVNSNANNNRVLAQFAFGF